MPFWKRNKDRPSKKEIEQMQDAKFSVAENLLAHIKIVDLSKIYLTEVPYGMLSVVKHQNKEVLIIKENELKDFKGNLDLLDELLKLDLSFNHFKSVPKNLPSLQSLVHLNLDHNLLTVLPAILGALPNLETLSARSNEIKSVAPEIGCLCKLITLNLTDNYVTKLPDNFAHCYCLTHLEVDLENFAYPPAEVVAKGGRATVLWLCEENNVDTSKVDHAHETIHKTIISGITALERNAQEMVLKHQAHRDEESAELMRKLKEEECDLKKMAEQSNLTEIKRRERVRASLETETKIESKKISEYLKFQDDVKMANIRAALLDVEEKDVDAERILAEIDKLREEERERLNIYIAEDEAVLKRYVDEHKLDIAFIAAEMQKVLEEDRLMDAFIQSAEKELQAMFTDVQKLDAEERSTAMNMVSELEKDKEHMLKMILEDEELQKKMFITAQQTHDRIYRTLEHEIESVQENLMLLTMLEKTQKDIDEQALDHIWSQRAEMAGLLTQLMHKQDERRQELEETAKMIESQFEDELANFWLYQYQMLMAGKPDVIRREEEEVARASHKAAEIESGYVLSGIKMGGETYPTPHDLPPAWKQGPSAPDSSTPDPSVDPSAPVAAGTPPRRLQRQLSQGTLTTMESESECCICLDKTPSVAFLPCGHVCCCADCGIVSVCPMCRTAITSTIKLYFTQSK